MTLTMGDGPPANIPPGLDALAGYVNDSGIGATWPAIQAMPARYHLSITTDGSPAMCADVESGAMSDWTGYPVGYCAVSNVNRLVAAYGRPLRLWTAHYTGMPHVCSPACWPGLVTDADGTQWTNHGGVWDQSLLNDNFFDFLDKENDVNLAVAPDGTVIVAGAATDNGDLLVFQRAPGANMWTVDDVTEAIHNAGPSDPRTYRVQ